MVLKRPSKRRTSGTVALPPECIATNQVAQSFRAQCPPAPSGELYAHALHMHIYAANLAGYSANIPQLGITRLRVTRVDLPRWKRN